VRDNVGTDAGQLGGTQKVRQILGWTITFGYPGDVNEMSIWTDADFAGCRKTRKSTSGGVAMLGNYMIKSWRTTQAIVSLSSGEAEYYGIVKGASIGLGLKSMLGDFWS
jgi:hypothetical protein